MGDSIMTEVMGWVVVILLGGFGFTILVKIWQGEIEINKIISEPDGSGASLSRFQFLVFTLVIAMSLFWVTVKTGTFPDIPNGVFALLGISGGSYVVAKGMHKSSQKKEGGNGSGGGGGGGGGQST